MAGAALAASLAAVLAGCGGGSGAAQDASRDDTGAPGASGGSGAGSPAASSPGADGSGGDGTGASGEGAGGASSSVETHVLGLLHGSAAGGSTGEPVLLGGPGDVADLGLDGRRAAPLVREVRRAYRDWRATGPADAWALAGAVVSVGCERPVDVEVETDPLRVTPVARAADKGVQCLVPVTTVALVEVPASAFA